MKMIQLQYKSAKELGNMLAEKQVVLRTFRFGIAGSNLKNVKLGSATKKDIARILTLQNSQKNMPESKVHNKKA